MRKRKAERRGTEKREENREQVSVVTIPHGNEKSVKSRFLSRSPFCLIAYLLFLEELAHGSGVAGGWEGVWNEREGEEGGCGEEEKDRL